MANAAVNPPSGSVLLGVASSTSDVLFVSGAITGDETRKKGIVNHLDPQCVCGICM